MSTKKIKYVSFDPGESTGWVTWDENGTMVRQGTCRGRSDLEELLEELGSVPEIVAEDFTLRKDKALQQSGSKLETVRVLGVIESWAYRNKSKITKQPASILYTAQLWSGMKMPKNHAQSHWVSAYNHGFYYLVKQGVRKLELHNE